MDGEKITISKKEYEKLLEENERLKKDKVICDEVLDYLSTGIEKLIKEWGWEDKI